ncbi:hybrid sensor histidine kinase/response regulator [Tateyamaria omphalii]|uniref:hybrid sensor histidine kinase/response regulator n=1 Tax=Tateyamaria omphalii TaxID=299262 RepID=UPI00167602EB|nr:PAS domain-containing hybrid sensor histidine kinase/response regulator [Tateyamaria omphalii]GGX59716.1 hybrid sensor histidine kinase/response regulator [Tateyamaria omphalii]
MGKKPITLFAGLLIAGLVFIIYLGRSVIEDLDALSTALHDDISWNMSQLEIETLNLGSAAHSATHDPNSDLSVFRKRYDIFYSRVTTLTQSAFYQAIRDDDEAQASLAATKAFLDVATPIVDSPDDVLRAALSDMQRQIEELRPQVRALALAGIKVFAEAETERRAEFSHTLVKLAASVLSLILLLLAALFILIKLHRRGQQVAHDNQVVRSRFEAAVSSSLDAVLVVDTNGRIVEFNGAAEAVFGFTRAEALGGDMAEMIVPGHLRDMHRKGMARYLETGEQKVIGAGRIRLEALRKSGEVFPVELSISLSEADGERVFVSFLRDITPELEAEEELKTARDKAQESEKAKSDLLTVMSHEMRTPLNGILGSLALIEQDTLNERQKRHLNSISVSGELLLSHVNDVLDLSSLSSDAAPQPKVTFDLREMVQQMADSLAANAQARGNTLTIEFLSDDLGTVCGAKRSLQQCLINLIGNAIKFTSDGVVGLEIERLNDTDLVEIRVSDTGVGIAPENLERIFEEFVTIDTTYARENVGTGLGLAITKRLVEAMEGEIEADSVPGEGSLFTLRLPLRVDRSKARKGGQPVVRTPAQLRAGNRVLVVDDNEINRMILIEMLRNIGFAVDEASDGYEAIEAVSSQRFDVLFLDISMPGIDGIETLDRIRKLDVDWSSLPTIAVTAHAAQKDHEAIAQASFADILVKPVRPEDLQTKLSSVLPSQHMNGDDQKEDVAENQFREQFGEAKYQQVLGAFHSDLADLVATLAGAQVLNQDTRDHAHKLSGSAAVLGERVVHGILQEIEHCDEVEWRDRRDQYIRDLMLGSD